MKRWCDNYDKCVLCCFFFSSRRRHTRFKCDWSSDVCSSDLTTTKTSDQGTKTKEGRSTREVILAAATRLIHVHGYNHTTLDHILRESGVGKGNFYYHFKSKEDLGYAILDQIVAAFLERTLDPCFSDPPARPLTQIPCFLDRMLEAQRQRNCVGGCPLGNPVAELSDV